ncbi:MAG: hypothetical protein QME94_10975 [Anaerolineae bacterium]|nr:hypothetical protein [Anaerolineae bacterium]
MALILADTSAWIEYDRATGSAADLRLRDLIASSGAVALRSRAAVLAHDAAFARMASVVALRLDRGSLRAPA